MTVSCPGSEVEVTTLHQHTVSALAASPGQKIAATGDMKGRGLRWSTGTADPLAERQALLPEMPARA